MSMVVLRLLEGVVTFPRLELCPQLELRPRLELCSQLELCPGWNYALAGIVPQLELCPE